MTHSYGKILKKIDKNMLNDLIPMMFDARKRKKIWQFYDFRKDWGHITDEVKVTQIPYSKLYRYGNL